MLMLDAAVVVLGLCCAVAAVLATVVAEHRSRAIAVSGLIPLAARRPARSTRRHPAPGGLHP